MQTILKDQKSTLVNFSINIFICVSCVFKTKLAWKGKTPYIKIDKYLVLNKYIWCLELNFILK